MLEIHYLTALMKIDIVYQHRDFIIIYKPCGVSVHKDQEEMGLTSIVAQQLNLPQLWLVHRLDKVTSGLLILAKNKQAATRLSQHFAAKQIAKTYIALSTQKPKKKQGLILGDMQKARGGAWKLCPSKENPAKTRFYSYSCMPNLRLFVLSPETGKTHQLRVAMKSLGSPILGDALYGSKDPADRVYLHAARLQFSYAGEDFCLQALPREGEYWQLPEVQQQIAAQFANKENKPA